MSRWRPVKQPVFGSSGQAVRRCGRWFDWGNCYRGANSGYQSWCTKCLANAQVKDGRPRRGYGGSPGRR